MRPAGSRRAGPAFITALGANAMRGEGTAERRRPELNSGAGEIIRRESPHRAEGDCVRDRPEEPGREGGARVAPRDSTQAERFQQGAAPSPAAPRSQ